MKLPENASLINFLTDIFDTNSDFAAEHEEEFFDNFRDFQNPRATVVKCSDSRVQMESYDKTPQNGVFAIRNIGNQIKTCEGSVDFGVRILKTPFLMILGHSACGAIEAVVTRQFNYMESMRKELETLTISSKDMKLATIENVNNQVDFAIQKYGDLLSLQELIIIGAVYDFKNDFGFGKGKLVLISINGEHDGKKIAASYAGKIKNLNLLSDIS